MRRIVLFLLTVLAAVSGRGQEPEAPDGQDRGGQMTVWFEPGGVREDFILKRLLTSEVAGSLGLNDEQSEKLRTGLEELHKQQVELVGQLARSAMRQAASLTEDKVDEEAVMREVEESGRLRTEIAKLRMRALLLVKATLTPEQFKALRQLMSRQIRQRREREEEGGGGEKREGSPGWKRFPWSRGREKWDHRKLEGNGAKDRGIQNREPPPGEREGRQPVVNVKLP